MSLLSSQNTNYTFRLLYVLAIFMILDGHIGTFDYLSFNGVFPYQNYHIALFVFASGYFINFKRSYTDFITHKFTKLILPLYVWNFVYAGLVYYLNHYHTFNLGGEISLHNLFIAPIVDGHQYIYNMASWFLVPLFLLQLISFVILKPFSLKKGELTWLVTGGYLLVSLLLGYAVLSIAPDNAAQRTFLLTLCRTFFFIPFYAFGVFYRYVLEKHDTLNTPVYLTLILVSTIILRMIFPYSDIVPSWLDYVEEPIWVIYAICLLALLFWLRIARIFMPIMKQSTALNYISTHTFDIMMHHFVGFMIVKAMLSFFGNFNSNEFKNSIWYYHFPFGENLTTPLYIIITLVIALIIGFTSQKICYMISKFFEQVRSHLKAGGLYE